MPRFRYAITLMPCAIIIFRYHCHAATSHAPRAAVMPLRYAMPPTLRRYAARLFDAACHTTAQQMVAIFALRLFTPPLRHARDAAAPLFSYAYVYDAYACALSRCR